MKLVKSCLVATVAAAALCARADVSKFDSRIAADTAMASADGMVWVDAAKLPMESKVCPDTETPFGRIPAALAEKVNGSIFCPSFGELENTLREMARPGDIILTVGAGDVYKIGEDLVK